MYCRQIEFLIACRIQIDIQDLTTPVCRIALMEIDILIGQFRGLSQGRNIIRNRQVEVMCTL